MGHVHSLRSRARHRNHPSDVERSARSADPARLSCKLQFARFDRRMPSVRTAEGLPTRGWRNARTARESRYKICGRTQQDLRESRATSMSQDAMTATGTVNVPALIDEQKVGSFQVRILMLCALAALLDGFAAQMI